jgi:hypothetical protein
MFAEWQGLRKGCFKLKEKTFVRAERGENITASNFLQLI